MNTALTILIVDDEEVVTYAYNHILTKKGYNVAVSKNALHILDTVETVAPNLILMDYNMPELNGADAIKKIKSDSRFSKIPVILFSANKNVDVLAADAGADAYFFKNEGYSQLVSLVERMIK